MSGSRRGIKLPMIGGNAFTRIDRSRSRGRSKTPLKENGTVMTLPFLGMFYGLHEWTAAHFGFGARTIALIDTMADSPHGQVAMIPMLAWIAKEARRNRKATYFAVMAAFTNLALSASQLGTKYLNKLFVVERGRYDELGLLMIVTTILGLVLPVLAVWALQPGANRGRPKPAERFKKLMAFSPISRPQYRLR